MSAAEAENAPEQAARPYYALNPALFDSEEHWAYRDLQRLAKRLDIPASGKRPELVERLNTWHREMRARDQAGKFHAVEVRANPGGQPINPSLLSPLKPPRQNPQPSPILSKGKHQADSPRRRLPLAQSPRTPKLSFSPFNMIKVIPSKEHTEMFGQYREPSNWDVDDDEED